MSIYFHFNFTPIFPDLTGLFAGGLFAGGHFASGFLRVVFCERFYASGFISLTIIVPACPEHDIVESITPKTSFGCLLTKKHLPFYWQVLMQTNLCLLFSKPFHSLFKACSVERKAPLGGVFQNGSQLVRAFTKEILN